MADLAHARENDTDLHGDADATHWAEQIAQAFQEAYDRLAPDFGFKAEFSEQNTALLVAVVQSLLDAGAMATTITAAQAHDGDVVRCLADGQVYQAPAAGGVQGWSHMQMIGFYGDPAATAPQGDLILLARDGQPHVASDHG